MADDDGGKELVHVPAGLPAAGAAPAVPAKAPEEDVRIELRDGKAFLGKRHGWCDPEEFMTKIQRIYNLAANLEKPAPGETARTVFSRLGLMLEFGLTKRQWNALAKLPGFDRACEMAATMAEAFMESLLLVSAGRNPAGAIFALKNTHDWKDQPDLPEEDAALRMIAAVIHLPAKRTPPTAAPA